MIPGGTRFGPYTIVSTVGAGGMGEVYRARDERLGRDVAIKVLPPSLIGSPAAHERFRREARAVAALQHPNICSIHDVGETADGHSFLVMEFLQGETLQQRISSGLMPIDAILDVAVALAGALEAAHDAGIVHRDIKPANIFLTVHGPKMLDFGLAKALPAQEPALTTRALDPMVTAPGSTVGTPAYMAPEQLRGEPADARSDLFSLGLVLYEMAAGRPAFAGATAPVITAAILHDQPVSLRILRSELPDRFEDVVVRAIEKDPALRYQHAADLRADLLRLKRDSGSRLVPVVMESRRSTISRAAWVAVAVVALLTGAWYMYGRRAPKLTEKDTIVLADFVNTTGDAVFDATLRQGLTIQLRQSPFLSVVPEERIQGVLPMMGKPPNTPLTPALAREICERTSSAAVLEGSIASLGTQYVLGLRAKNCRTGEVLDEQQVQAPRKEDVLAALSQVAIAFRTKVGESLATVQRHGTPLAEATTPSLDALKAYSAGLKALMAVDLPGGVPFLKRAVEIDPGFAMAYASLGFTYGLMGDLTLSAENNRKAYELRDRASDREKFYITATYDLYVTGNLERAQQTCETWMRTYPREFEPLSILGAFVYPTFGQFDKGAEVARKTIEMRPDFPVGYLQLGFNQQFGGDVTEAEKTFQRASERKVETLDFFPTRFDIAFLKGDQAAMDREAAQAQGKVGAEDAISLREGFVFAYAGRLGEARKKARRAVDLASQAKQPGRAALFQAAAAQWEAFYGNVTAARQGAAAALELSKDRDLEFGAAFALALSGESSRSEALAADLEARFPEDSEVKVTYVPAIRALLALNRREPARAVELLKAAAPYDLGTPLSVAPGLFGPLYTVYVRGLAYLAGRHGTEAADEFQKVLDRRTVVVSDAIGALAHLQLGRALAIAGETRAARAAYQDFLELWKAADADVPLLAQARRELAALP
jgi:serine/threonine protein kinase/Tfp pilus assembly protein PilF